MRRGSSRGRGVAQPGSAQRSGRWGRQFESGHPDLLIDAMVVEAPPLLGRPLPPLDTRLATSGLELFGGMVGPRGSGPARMPADLDPPFVRSDHDDRYYDHMVMKL